MLRKLDASILYVDVENLSAAASHVTVKIAQFFVLVLTSPGCRLSFDCLRARAPGFLISQAAAVPVEAATR